MRLALTGNGLQVRVSIVACGCGMGRQESERLFFLLMAFVGLTFFPRWRRFVATLRGHVGAVYRLTWSADSRLLVSASKDSTLKVRALDFDMTYLDNA